MQAVEDIEAGVIRSASEADQLGVYVPAPTQGSLCGRIVKDWTQVVGGILTGVGLVGGGVGIALDHYPVLLGAAAATLASSLLLCMRISCLKPRKELEREVAHFKGEVERLERNEARLNAQKEALIKASDEAQASIRTLGNMLSVPANKIVRTKDQLAAIEEKLRALVDLYQRYKAVTEAFSLELKAFKSNQKVHAQTVDRLEKAVQKIDEEGLQEEVGDYQEAGAFHRQQNEKLQQLLSEFKTDFSTVQKKFLLMRRELEELRQHVSKLDEADDKFRKGGADFKEGVVLAQEEFIPQIKSAMQRLDNALAELAADSEEEGKSEENN